MLVGRRAISDNRVGRSLSEKGFRCVEWSVCYLFFSRWVSSTDTSRNEAPTLRSATSA